MGKLNELSFLLSESKYDLVVITETFLAPNHPDSLLLAGNEEYSLFRNDRSDRIGGGVAVFCKSRYFPVAVDVRTMLGTECVAIELHGSSSPYIVFAAYRAPDVSLLASQEFVFLH